LVTFEPVTASATVGTTVSSSFAESHNDDVLLKDIDFRRGNDSAGRVVVSLPNNQTGVDLKVQGQSLVVEFQKSSLPEGLRPASM
jgi:type IV pilus assembly protein PilQ